jgi:hypothetical protein
MKFVKEEDEKTRNYIFQKDEKTKKTTAFVAIMLVVLVAAVIASGLYFKWF